MDKHPVALSGGVILMDGFLLMTPHNKCIKMEMLAHN